MQNVLFALNNQEIEYQISEVLDSRFNVVGYASNMDQIARILASKKIDILVVRETISGRIGLCDFISYLRKNYSGLEIYLVTKTRYEGDLMLDYMSKLGVSKFVVGGMVRPKLIYDAIMSGLDLRSSS